MQSLTRRAIAGAFAASLALGAAACGDDDDGGEDVEQEVEDVGEDIQDTGDEVEDTIDENVDVGGDAENQGD